jgi:hypothetical protein
MQGMQGKSNQQIIDENLARGTTIQSLPENFFQTASAGARRVGDYVNQLGNAQQIVNKLFPSNIGNSQRQVPIPTSFNFAPKQAPTGEVIPAGLQTQSVPVANILQAIKPADVLGISGAERTYGALGAGKAPQPLDVVDTLGVGAIGLGATGGLLKATKGLPVGMSIQEAKGLLQVAPKSDIGFYSAVEQAAITSPRKSATGQAFLNDIMKGQDVRADEIKWMGLDDYLKGKQNVTKQEVQDYIANNRVNVQEVRLGESVAEDPVGIAKRKAVFDKYEPEIQGLYKDIDQYETNIINARNLASKNEAEAIAALNREGNPQPIPTTEDYNRYNLAKAEMERVNKIPLDSREYVRKLDELVRARDAEANKAYTIPETVPTKFGQYQLPGGENYRELLLTMPNKSVTQATERAAELKNKYDGYQRRMLDIRSMYPGLANRPPEIQSEFENLLKISSDTANEMRNIRQASSAEAYKSSHFPETPNILAHLRVNDRVDADGKKMLLIEEVQSDWHQAGRDKGYETKELKNALEEYERLSRKYASNNGKLPPDELARIKELQPIVSGKAGGVPDAPFKDTWYQLALKRAIQHAAENGYDRIGLTTGSQQAKRFDLSQQIGQINARPTPDGKIALEAMTPDMGSQVFNKVVNANELDGIVGKEIAEKIKNQIEYPKSFDDRGKSVELSGLDLQVGGEGMKKYYDEIYPKFLDKYGKKWGAKVGETNISTDRGNIGGMPSMYPNKATVRYIDITPEMKAGVSKGQPLFAAVPAIPAAGLLAPQEKRR